MQLKVVIQDRGGSKQLFEPNIIDSVKLQNEAGFKKLTTKSCLSHS